MTSARHGLWRKLGRIFDGGSAVHSALRTHAALPTPYDLGGDLVRVFYSGRNAMNHSSVGSFVLRLSDAPRLEDKQVALVLEPGGTGSFDDAGVGVGCVVPAAGGDRLYYMGWNIGGSVPWRNAIGVAFGNAREARFERHFIGPIMDRSPLDPFSLSYPWVLNLAPHDWQMWYGTHLKWGGSRTDMGHAIRSARSIDGLEWQRDPEICVPAEDAEIATVRPSVLHRPSDGGFEMYFAAREMEGPYTIGRATSADGRNWKRADARLQATADWEHGALTYPAIFEQAGRRWMLFNGDGYGATGVGIAVWEGE